MRLWQVSNGGVRMSAESRSGRKRVTRLVVVVVVAFASLWFPIQTILLLRSFGWDTTTPFTVMLQIISQILAYTSSCINPLLYAFLSDNFRKAFDKVSIIIFSTLLYSIQYIQFYFLLQ
uniref:G-protein coupled receptors family 1 profile domain-containing protein n=1 Tax=Megaselia scalaris TaxID=36166 RepID=T1GMM0_MEGSC